jgi:class 3 adenylate cyclase
MGVRLRLALEAARPRGPDQAHTAGTANPRRQAGSAPLFEIEDLGSQALAGFAEPQRAWQVIGESGVLNRFEALRSEGRTTARSSR